MQVEIDEESATYVTLTVRAPVAGFSAVLADFFADVDTEELMGHSLARSPSDAAKGVLSVLLDAAKEWEADV